MTRIYRQSGMLQLQRATITARGTTWRAIGPTLPATRASQLVLTMLARETEGR